MNQIAGLLPVANILLELDVANKKRVFEQVGLLFENQHGIARGVAPILFLAAVLHYPPAMT